MNAPFKRLILKVAFLCDSAVHRMSGLQWIRKASRSQKPIAVLLTLLLIHCMPWLNSYKLTFLNMEKNIFWKHYIYIFSEWLNWCLHDISASYLIILPTLRKIWNGKKKPKQIKLHKKKQPPKTKQNKNLQKSNAVTHQSNIVTRTGTSNRIES